MTNIHKFLIHKNIRYNFYFKNQHKSKYREKLIEIIKKNIVKINLYEIFC